jgi:hypothetical protein
MMLSRLAATCRFISARRAWPFAWAVVMICSVCLCWAWCCGRNSAVVRKHRACQACVRCPLLRIDPAQLPRLEAIHANLSDRLQEAREQGWLGEVAAIESTMAAAEQKLQGMKEATERGNTVGLGMPNIHQSTRRSGTASENHQRN